MTRKQKFQLAMRSALNHFFDTVEEGGETMEDFTIYLVSEVLSPEEREMVKAAIEDIEIIER